MWLYDHVVLKVKFNDNILEPGALTTQDKMGRFLNNLKQIWKVCVLVCYS